MRLIITVDNELLICEAVGVSRDSEKRLIIDCSDASHTVFTSISKCSFESFKKIIDNLFVDGSMDLHDIKFKAETLNIIE